MAPSTFTGPLYATTATSAISLSVAVSKLLLHYPVLSAQAVRYAIGAAALLAVARLLHQRLPRPTGRDLALLLALGAVGLAGFNSLLLAALARAEPAAVGVVVGCVPILLALAGPLLARRAPSGQVVAAAVVAAVGAGVVQGAGQATAAGLAAAAGALAAEALFSLLAVPLLPRLGPLAVAAYACLAAVVLLGIGAPLLDGPVALRVPTAGEAGAVAFLGLVVTAGPLWPGMRRWSAWGWNGPGCSAAWSRSRPWLARC
jgi:drug/metabolite transporter (DMT)-like permease